MLKLGFSDSNQVKRFFWLSQDSTELHWGNSSDDSRYLRVRLSEVIGLSFGPVTTTFSRISVSDKKLLPWCCFSLIFVGRTLDLSTFYDNAHLWFLKLQRCIVESGGLLVSEPSYRDVIKRKVLMKVRYRAESLGRTFSGHIRLTARQAFFELYGEGKGGTRAQSALKDTRNVRRKVTILRSCVGDLRSLVQSWESEQRDFLVYVREAIVDRCKTYQQSPITENEELERLRKDRKKLHNDLMELRGNIRVCVRVRPLLPRESDDAEEATIIIKDDSLGVFNSMDARRRVYEFDKVIGPLSSQEDVFTYVEPFITSFIDGFNVCLFAYGVTNSGKTFTMEGSPKSPGVTRRTLNKILSEIPPLLTASLSAVQIYNETAYDLLNEARPVPIKIEGKAFSIQGLVETVMHDVNQAEDIISAAARLRSTNLTKLNDSSSRSHFIVIVSLRDVSRGALIMSKLNLVDLAGSENVNRSGASGIVLKEAQAINRSLSALGDVINALLSRNHQHVPFRNSKLTMLLKDSLEGNAKALMIVQASPCQDDVAETMGSLQFASRVRNVELGKAKKHHFSA